MSIQSTDKTTKQYFLVFVAAAILYTISCAPSLLWQDSGMIQYRVLNNDIEGGLGLALSHPLYYIISIIAKYVPIGNVIGRINMISALAGAFAIANLYLLIKLWLGQTWPAIISAVTLAVSHTFWQHASIVETYDMYIVFFLAELICLLLYLQNCRTINICLLGLFNGLAISVHMMAIIPLACYTVYIVYLLINRRIKIQTVMLFIFFWILGALPYEYLIARQMIQTGDFLATVKSALFGKSWQGDVLNTSINVKIIKENILFMVMNFPTPNIILATIGLYSIFRNNKLKKFGAVIIVFTGLFFIFAFRYTVPDRYAFFLPFYTLLSILIGVGNSLSASQWN